LITRGHSLKRTIGVEEVDRAACLEHAHVHRGVLLVILRPKPNAEKGACLADAVDDLAAELVIDHVYAVH